MKPIHARTVGLLILMLPPVLTGCDEDNKFAEHAKQAEARRQAEVQRLAELQAKLEAEQLQRRQAEEAARAAEDSRSRWIFGLGAGAASGCVIAVLVGVHIGSRALAHYQKEHPDAQ